MTFILSTKSTTVDEFHYGCSFQMKPTINIVSLRMKQTERAEDWEPHSLIVCLTYLHVTFIRQIQAKLIRNSQLSAVRVSRACWLFHNLFNLAATWLSVRNGNCERYSAFLFFRNDLKHSLWLLVVVAILSSCSLAVIGYAGHNSEVNSFRPREWFLI